MQLWSLPKALGYVGHLFLSSKVNRADESTGFIHFRCNKLHSVYVSFLVLKF